MTAELGIPSRAGRAGRSPWSELPRELAEHVLPHLDLVAEEIIAEIRVQVREYSRGEGPYASTLRTVVERALAHFVARLARGGPHPDPDFFQNIGRGEAGEGRSLDPLQSAVRVGGLVAWRRLARNAWELEPRMITALCEAVFVHQDDIARQAAEGYRQAQAAVAGEMQRRRRRLLDLLLSESTGHDAIADLAAAAHWPMPRTVAAVALDIRHQDTRPPAFPPDVLVDLERTQPSLIIPDPDGPGRQQVVDRALADCAGVIGPTVAVTEAAHSMRLARNMLQLGQRGVIDAEGVVRCVDHMSTLILFQDEQLLKSLAELRLAPLAHLRSSQQDRLAETLLAWLQSGRNANEVAMRLHVHPQTVRYRLRQLEELFGDQLLDPDLRFDLEIVLRARRLQQSLALTPATPDHRAVAGEVISLRRL
ncbi:helix-turn-helix domain-containing protein [Actinocorallia sp. API 0066]|uniref:PucR family transcriptional regulator n=1 Tax=Actinocorallia sp. API 0066 TaxID=2896846 RepID=UPI001E44FCFD|nr:PucR family transcriptional regulator [Actinocorallia sp. API 0066]MCD0450559.1 helix-turn-helix domain-containing protein [Actinocorallia sp. API 0066]